MVGVIGTVGDVMTLRCVPRYSPFLTCLGGTTMEVRAPGPNHCVCRRHGETGGSRIAARCPHDPLLHRVRMTLFCIGEDTRSSVSVD